MAAQLLQQVSQIGIPVKELDRAITFYSDILGLPPQGVVFAGEPHLVTRMNDTETWMAFFTDSEGNTMALVSEVAA